MVRLSKLWLRLATALLLGLTIAACSSSGEDSGTGTGGAPGAADTSGGGQGTTGELKQTFDLGLEVTSAVFNDIRRIPKDHTCGGKVPSAGSFFEQGYDASRTYPNTSPPIEWTGAPEGTVSFALLMESDEAPGKIITQGETRPDAQKSHWVIWNIPGDATGLPEAVPTTTDVLAIGAGTRQGTNDDATLGYSGPCPLPVSIVYHGFGKESKPKVVYDYVFHVFALDTELDLGPETTDGDLLKAMEGHVLAGGKVTGQFAARTKKLTP